MTARTPEERAREIVENAQDCRAALDTGDIICVMESDLVKAISAALSADPVAEAAIRLAEVVDERSFFQYARVYRGERVVWACHFCGGSGDAPRLIEHEDGCALAKYRQAREGRK